MAKMAVLKFTVLFSFLTIYSFIKKSSQFSQILLKERFQINEAKYSPAGFWLVI